MRGQVLISLLEETLGNHHYCDFKCMYPKTPNVELVVDYTLSMHVNLYEIRLNVVKIIQSLISLFKHCRNNL